MARDVRGKTAVIEANEKECFKNNEVLEMLSLKGL